MSGYCECEGKGERTEGVTCEHEPFTCADECHGIQYSQHTLQVRAAPPTQPQVDPPFQS
jgi:hypothetical protein